MQLLILLTIIILEFIKNISAIVLIILAVLLLFFFFKSLLFICKNFKLFKKVFSVSKPLKIKELVQISSIILFGIISISLLINLIVLSSTTFERKKIVPYKHATKKALSSINQALLLKVALDNEKILYENEFELVNIFIDRLNIQDAKNIEHNGNYKTYSKQEIRDYNLLMFKDKPIITTVDGMIYTFKKFEKGCRVVNLEDIEKSSCLLVVDVNGIKKPNKLTMKNPQKEGSDRFIFVLDGNIHKVLLPKIYDNWFLK